MIVVYFVITRLEEPPAQAVQGTTVVTVLIGVLFVRVWVWVLGGGGTDDDEVLQGIVRVTVVGVAAQTLHTVVVTVIPGGGTYEDELEAFPGALEVVVGQYVTVWVVVFVVKPVEQMST